MVHVIQFFGLSNNPTMATTLAIAFEVGAAASLASIIVLDKMNKFIVWSLFLVLTAMQIMGNTFYAFAHLHDFTGWIQLFGLQDMDAIEQKRILAIVSGAVLPIVALGFIKALVDYIKPASDTKPIEQIQTTQTNQVSETLSDETKETDSIAEVVETTDMNTGDEVTNKEINETPIVHEDILKDVDQTVPAFKQMVEEYINKTRTGTRHPKTTPGLDN
jgi:hypothetical protein